MKAALNNQTEYNISLLELVFSVRNKDYGAYALRTSYKRNLTIALIITVFTFVTLITLPLFLKNDLAKNNIYKKPPTSIPIDLQNPPQTDEEIIKIPDNITHLDVAKIKFVVPKVVDDPFVTEETTIPTTEEMEGKVISTVNQTGNEGENLLPTEDNMNIGTDKIIETQPSEIFHWVEEMPSYPGGTEELLTFINKNIEYPEIAKRAGVEGRVLLGFVVEQDGTLTDINILKGIGAGCDEEAERVLRLVGKWIPGKQNGKAVRVSMVMPFVFKLN